MLGNGCFGIVRKKGEFAVKRVKDNSYKNTLNSIREIDILSKISDSDYCLGADEIIVDNKGRLAFKMKLGVCNADRWCSKQVMLHVALGLEHLHRQNIIHGDVKMANMIVFDDYSGKLIDFGLSIQGPVDNFEIALYADALRAPEIRNGNNYTTACDVWAYGIALLNFMKVINNSDYDKGFHKKLDSVAKFGDDIIRKIFKHDPTERATITEVIDSPYFAEFSDTIDTARKKYNNRDRQDREGRQDCEVDRDREGRQELKDQITNYERQFPDAVTDLAAKIATRCVTASEDIKDDPNFIPVCLMIANKYYNLRGRGSKFIINDLNLEKRIVFDLLKNKIV